MATIEKIRRFIHVPTPYATMISRQHFQSRVFYALIRYKETLFITSPRISANYWRRLDSREAVPVPIPTQKPWITSCYVINAPMRQLITTGRVFHITSVNPMHLKALLPFGRRTTIFQMHYVRRFLSLNSVWVHVCYQVGIKLMFVTFHQCLSDRNKNYTNWKLSVLFMQ